MLTARGWWVLFASLAVALFGVLPAAPVSPMVAVLGISLLVWFVGSWVLFAARYRGAMATVSLQRTLWLGDRPVSTAWARVPCRIRVEVMHAGQLAVPLVFVEDRLPEGVKPKGTGDERQSAWHPHEPLVLEYDLRPGGPGILAFEGVALRAVDLCGFFYRRTFLRDRVEFLVLPQLLDEDGRARALKRFNTLPPPGVHRLRRAGGGSELLDLRDYRAGDPPKMIAWKASARRDRLITKEFESDVPVRCLLFLDTSAAVRTGLPGQTPLCKLVDVAAAVAQAAASNRDIVGLTTFDENAAKTLPPARTRVHGIRMLARFAEAAGLMPEERPAPADLMMRYAWPLAEELYPDLLASDLNSRPFGMYWLPLLDTRWGWLVLAAILAPVLLLKREVAEVVAQAAAFLGGRGYVLIGFLAIALVIPAFAILFWFLHGIRGAFPPRSTQTRKRKLLGGLFATLDADSPAAIERFMKDDAAFAARAAKFLASHRVRGPAGGTDPFAEQHAAAKVAVLAQALTRAIAVAKDNEVYVILADLAELGDDPDALVRAVRVARGRHHHVIVVVPWPEGIPAPAEAKSHGRPVAQPVVAFKRGKLRIAQLVHAGLIHRYQRRFLRVRGELVRLGATVIRVEDGDGVRTVLDRLDRARGGRLRR